MCKFRWTCLVKPRKIRNLSGIFVPIVRDLFAFGSVPQAHRFRSHRRPGAIETAPTEVNPYEQRTSAEGLASLMTGVRS
jgi:hypothetical protein